MRGCVGWWVCDVGCMSMSACLWGCLPPLNFGDAAVGGGAIVELEPQDDGPNANRGLFVYLRRLLNFSCGGADACARVDKRSEHGKGEGREGDARGREAVKNASKRPAPH